MCNEELVDALMLENDKNGDGVIDFSEFKQAMLSAKQKIDKQTMDI